MHPDDWPVQPQEVLIMNLVCLTITLVIEAVFCAGLITAWQFSGS